jgi:hypothetical protein
MTRATCTRKAATSFSVELRRGSRMSSARQLAERQLRHSIGGSPALAICSRSIFSVISHA